MKEDKYLFTRLPEEYYYEFISMGPKGRIKKIVRLRLIGQSTSLIYNLGFGDWDEENSDVNYTIRTNNRDMRKVLATLSGIILEFMSEHPGVSIFVIGSSASRTRLYQMGIAAYWEEIDALFTVLAFIQGKWQLFKKGCNYEAFLIKRK